MMIANKDSCTVTLHGFTTVKNARHNAQPKLQSHSLLGIAQDRIHPLKGLKVAVGSLHS